MAKPAFLLIILIFSLPLQAQVYRCDSPQGAVYSQMPCEEDAERLAEYDPMVETDVMATEEEGGSAGNVAAKAPTAMEKFIVTLENQREQQLSAIDQNISQLQKQLSTEGEQASDESVLGAIESELSALIAERESIREQYAALINEAASRSGSLDNVN